MYSLYVHKDTWHIHYIDPSNRGTKIILELPFMKHQPPKKQYGYKVCRRTSSPKNWPQKWWYIHFPWGHSWTSWTSRVFFSARLSNHIFFQGGLSLKKTKKNMLPGQSLWKSVRYLTEKYQALWIAGEPHHTRKNPQKRMRKAANFCFSRWWIGWVEIKKKTSRIPKFGGHLLRLKPRTYLGRESFQLHIFLELLIRLQPTSHCQEKTTSRLELSTNVPSKSCII